MSQIHNCTVRFRWNIEDYRLLQREARRAGTTASEVLRRFAREYIKASQFFMRDGLLPRLTPEQDWRYRKLGKRR